MQMIYRICLNLPRSPVPSGSSGSPPTFQFHSFAHLDFALLGGYTRSSALVSRLSFPLLALFCRFLSPLSDWHPLASSLDTVTGSPTYIHSFRCPPTSPSEYLQSFVFGIRFSRLRRLLLLRSFAPSSYRPLPAIVIRPSAGFPGNQNAIPDTIRGSIYVFARGFSR